MEDSLPFDNNKVHDTINLVLILDFLDLYVADDENRLHDSGQGSLPYNVYCVTKRPFIQKTNLPIQRGNC